YNKLPELHEARNALHKRTDYLLHLKNIGQIFIKHDVQDNFGVILLHKHFEIDKDQNMVELVSNDKTNTSPIYVKIDNAISPHSWIIKNGKVIPYEYYVGVDRINPNQNFINEYNSYLKNNNLDTLFGLHLVHRKPQPDKTWIEHTEGKCNIM
ncbi:hypothetical protein COEREDRAFT_36450, partial [Coemansia reversa NRRL 1564]